MSISPGRLSMTSVTSKMSGKKGVQLERNMTVMGGISLVVGTMIGSGTSFCWFSLWDRFSKYQHSRAYFKGSPVRLELTFMYLLKIIKSLFERQDLSLDLPMNQVFWLKSRSKIAENLFYLAGESLYTKHSKKTTKRHLRLANWHHWHEWVDWISPCDLGTVWFHCDCSLLMLYRARAFGSRVGSRVQLL